MFALKYSRVEEESSFSKVEASCYRQLVIIWLVISIVGILWYQIFQHNGSTVVQAEISNMFANSEEIHTPLLLESGMVKSKTGELSLIIWLPDDKQLEDLEGKLAASPMSWSYKEIGTMSGQTAVTIAGKTTVNTDEERWYKTFYGQLQKQVSVMGGQVYLDERIEERLNGEDFMTQNQITLLQSIKSGATWSWAGYGIGGGKGIKAGKDMINYQILTRESNDGSLKQGETVLAIPALLQEF